MENNPETPAARQLRRVGYASVQLGEESEASAVDPLLLGGVSDDAPEPNYAEALASQGAEAARGGQEHMPNPVGDQPPPVQIARAATPASPCHSELSRMEGGGVVARIQPKMSWFRIVLACRLFLKEVAHTHKGARACKIHNWQKDAQLTLQLWTLMSLAVR